MCRYAQFSLSSRQLNYRGFPLIFLKWWYTGPKSSCKQAYIGFCVYLTPISNHALPDKWFDQFFRAFDILKIDKVIINQDSSKRYVYFGLFLYSKSPHIIDIRADRIIFQKKFLLFSRTNNDKSVNDIPGSDRFPLPVLWYTPSKILLQVLHFPPSDSAFLFPFLSRF